MEADPLFNVKQLFYQSSYKACISEATSRGITPSDSSESLHRAIYVARSHLASSPPTFSSALSVLSPFTALDPAPAPARAFTALTSYLEAKSKGDSAESHVDEVRDVVLEFEGEEGDDEEGVEDEGLVRVAAGTIFVLEGEAEEAVATLTEGAAKKHLESMAVLVQLLLSLDRRDLAQSTYNNAKRIGNDSLLVQAIEAWIGLKTGARPLHQSYYFYEELYQLPNGRTPPVLASHAASHLLLGHIDEAKADISEAQQQQGGATDPNVLAVGASLGMDGFTEKLESDAPTHPFAIDLKEKASLFDEAAAKFTIAA